MEVECRCISLVFEFACCCKKGLNKMYWLFFRLGFLIRMEDYQEAEYVYIASSHGTKKITALETILELSIFNHLNRCVQNRGSNLLRKKSLR